MADHWDELEVILETLFKVKERKGGGPMVNHSLDVGRILRSDPRADDIAIFGGYCHDVLEDTNISRTTLLTTALFILMDNEAAEKAVKLVEECSYTKQEYELPKADRKKTAVARWTATDDIRVMLVKSADVASNKKDARNVSEEFEKTYLGWAQPLQDRLDEKLEALAKSAENMMHKP